MGGVRLEYRIQNAGVGKKIEKEAFCGTDLRQPG